MSSLYELEKQRYIVPVSCGSKRGTAFFVDGGKLLTARHVVEEHLRHRKPVHVYMEDGKKMYKAVSADATNLMVDVAILEPIDPNDTRTEYELPLLAIENQHAKDMHLTIIGFPEELGSGSSQIEIKVKNHSEIKNKPYDILTVREDHFELRMYNGFSGAPVITEGGFVVGVVSTETYGKLGYCSISHIQNALRDKGVKGISEDWETNDDTLFSRRKSYEQIEEAVTLAGPRYHRGNHQKDDSLMKTIESFCVYQKFVEAGRQLANVEKKIAQDPRINTTLANGYVYTNGDYDNLQKYIEMLIASSSNEGSADITLRTLKRKVELNYPRYQKGRLKYLRIAGVAGTGKTHFSCFIAETLRDKAYPYLLFGSQFNIQEQIWSQLSNMLPYGGRSKDTLKTNLVLLDDRMKQVKQFAVIIIDALNEGAGEFYWKDSLRLLTEEISKHERIKLIITIRDPFVNRIMSGMNDTEWVKYDLKGFSSPVSISKAIQSYFEDYGIDETLVRGFRQQFKLPLFLLIFCQSFGYLTEEERKNLSRIILYKRYLKARNVGVANIVSEDEKLNITWDMMNKLACYSVKECYSGVVPRAEARTIADTICKRELWQHNLLNALLKENLLMETLSDDDKDMVMFEFENIADVLKANALLESNMSEMVIIDLLKDTASYLKQNNLSVAKFENMVTALIAMWNRNQDVTDIEEFMLGEFRPMLIRATLEYSTEENGKKIKDWLDEHKSENAPYNLLEHLDDLASDLYNRFDLTLASMSMKERDEEWTILVNDFFESKKSWGLLEQKSQLEGLAQSRLLLVAVWMLTTSFPDSRQFLIGLIYRLLLKNENQALFILEDFKSCDDHYVVTGLYCAVYGFTLRTQNRRVVGEIADFVKKRYYSHEDGKVVADIELRQWTMMILDRAEYLNPLKPYFTDLELPFTSSLPTKRMLKNVIPENYFGEGKGASSLYFSLSPSSDFYRYTIGGNSKEESHEFYEMDEKAMLKPLKLLNMLKMIAYIINHDYKYKNSRILDHYDADIYTRDRHHNTRERIGKKYQWLALWRIYAQLSDNYWFNVDRYYPDPMELTRKVWPWMTRMYDRNDPTMPTFKEMEEYTKELEFLTENDDKAVTINSGMEWVEADKSHPTINTQYIDESGDVWVLLDGYQSDKIEADKEQRHRILRYNCCFVLEKDAAKMKSWAAEQDFSGEWMEHRSDCIDFRWNEFPWAHAYKRLDRDAWVKENGLIEYPCAVKVAYDEQLQEEVYGMVEEKDYHSFRVAMPCAELVETMNLYTAERGIIRRMDDDTIAAVSLSVLKQSGSGVLIKKDILCQFMKQQKYRLYCYLSGNKNVSAGSFAVIHSKNLTGCMAMTAKGTWSVVQELKLSEK